MKMPISRGMRTLAMAGMVAMVAACTAYAPRHDTPGPTVARHLQERYAETFPSCLKYPGDLNPLPSVLCSGVLMRATNRGQGYDVWNPNPNSPTPNGVPFSWLRQDAKFSELVFGYANGFIILPYFYADAPSDGYTQLTVLCVFPFDGATNARTRESRDGCGSYPGIAGSGPCQAQGINTAAQWLARFRNGGMYGNQCGFRLLPQTPNAWQAFQAHWQIRQALPVWFPVHNEIMVGAWAQGDKRIPLEAFFYINGNTVGLGQARANQMDFKTRTGRWVPVIRINLPPGPANAAAFLFNVADQGIPQ